MQSLRNFWCRVESIRPFTEREAWNLFRFGAIGEAFGWAVLMTAILYQHTDLPGREYAVPIGGSFHGTMFLIYFGLLIAVSTSLRWSFAKVVTALVCGVPPFGSLVFELVAARKRQKIVMQSSRRIYVRGILKADIRVLGVLPSNSTEWVLPGGYLVGLESPEEALKRIMYDMTEKNFLIHDLVKIEQSKSNDELLFYFNMYTVVEELDLRYIPQADRMIDEAKFITAEKIDYFQRK